MLRSLSAFQLQISRAVTVLPHHLVLQRVALHQGCDKSHRPGTIQYMRVSQTGLSLTVKAYLCH